MEIISEKNLVDRTRLLGDKAQRRLWIASPYLGSYESIRRILGRKWVEDNKIEIHLLTDIQNGNLSPKAIKCFNDKGTIKTIQGLHAKIYIIDDRAILTSANLTGTAFSRRYEVGITLTRAESRPLIKLYKKWWSSVAEDIPPDWTPPARKKKKHPDEDEPGVKLPKLWSLPSDPGDPNQKIGGVARNYELFLKSYAEFSEIYKNIQRIWPNRPLYFETDSFLNYLFHHERQPSARYKSGAARKLREVQRQQQIRKHARRFKKWILAGSEGVESKKWRESSCKTIQRVLSKKKILKMKRREAEEVADNLNCLNSVPLSKYFFLRYNNIKTIRAAWYDLLYNEKTPLQMRISKCMGELYSFKK